MTKEHKITIYSTPSCPYCVQLKNYLKEQGFKYIDIDVSKDHKKAEEMIEKSGQMGVPVADIDGQIIIGFNKEKVKKVLGIK
ncbi:MAG: glutaredoxin domain-containing protein [bacterium]|nr:glutaredoxin domain-containing protein [bacterium]